MKILPLTLPTTSAEIPNSRSFYLAARASEAGRLPYEAREAILVAVESLYDKEIVPALRLPSATLWRSLRR
ncbi:hypothetical protein [Bordetella holmesii]|uniref:Uncharacterized protein n=2 Tax=Bordetella holmesii TaxID=35814 RepID=A0A158M1J5_9BORD|nr:hypothetical protein [Bordetella holmesii]AHV94343.1 lysR family transcriptional regulator domain protein [Bordetella holmesii ATCC 51541]AIT27944.1 lysR family transcriptional regulator domain protein [Bordetella holmesii 44057]EWM40720.1 lysR family transcriptional regulator domain protein [Bordetella holmesii 35009]EWM42535.1 lysR family transcriptional regulator domain protein [Bordetella holmesii 41130]EWM44617.1 lysR family transcriptional regulator domain protein [Bordetella holmesii